MTEQQKPGVMVTLDDIYQLVQETKELVAPLPDKVNDHEARLRGLEAFRNRASGVGASLMLLSGCAGALISHLIK